MTPPANGSARICIEGIAFWAPRLPGWPIARAVLRGEEPPPQTSAPRPTPTILPPAERRRAPDAVALALEVAAAACAAAGCDPTTLASVFASTEGDLTISDYMSATLAKSPLLVSPTKFHNSVHNAPAGYWTIATGSQAPYTALSAHQYTFASGLLEALVQAAASTERILFVAYDNEARGPLATMTKSRGLLAAGLIVSPLASSNAAPRLLWSIAEQSRATPLLRPQNADLVAGNALAGCLPFFEALADARGREILLPLSRGTALRLQLED